MASVQATVVYIDKAGERPQDHPFLEFTWDHQEAFDHGNMKSEPFTNWHTDDFTFTKTDGTALPPGEESWKGWLEGYASFTEHCHEARYVCAYEHDGLWEMLGIANVFANLPVPGERTKKDLSGRAWDVVTPGAFHFKCVKDTNGQKGFKVKSLSLFGDGVPILGELVKREMVKPEDVFK